VLEEGVEMSYQTGTATGPTDLLDKIRSFLLSDGWTVNNYSSIGAGYRLHVQKTFESGNTCFFNFRSAVGETGSTLIAENNIGDTNGTVTGGILINGSTGYDIGELWHKQPGYSLDPQNSNKSYAGCMNPMSLSAIPAYYIFSTGYAVHVVVEATSGKFQFMSFGLLEKLYFTVKVDSAPSGGVYLDVDSIADWRVNGTGSYIEIAWPCVAGQATANADYTKGGMGSFFWSKSPNFYNNIAALCPIFTFGKRSDGNYSILGWPAGVRFMNVTNYSAGQELTYGDETWKVFPANDVHASEAVRNDNCGFAFLKEV
jgi:hypothetical protein